MFIETQTASASSTLSFTTLDAAYSSFLFILDDIRPATDDAQFLMRVRPSAGSFQTTGYLGLITVGDRVATQTWEATNGIPVSKGTGSIGVGNNANYGLHGHATIKVAGTGRHGVTGHSAYLQSNDTAAVCSFGGFYDTNGALDGVQFRFDSGNITSGTIRLYGIKV